MTELFKGSVLEELAKVAVLPDNTVEHAKLPPGVAFQETETITARTNEKKDVRKVIDRGFQKKLAS